MTKAKDVMTEDVAVVRGSATVAEAMRLMKLNHCVAEFSGCNTRIMD